MFFFFQAEDGIRDGHVTGVQTCALPISATSPAADHHADLCEGGSEVPAHPGSAVEGRGAMSALQTALDEYLALHRALGFKLEMHGWMLQRFVQFAERQGASYITTELALQWATQPAHAQPCRWAIRLGVVRRFAQYLSPSDPRVTVPPPQLL